MLPQDILLFVAILDGDVYLISFSPVYHLYVRGKLIFFKSDLVSCHITEGVYQL